MLWSAEFFAHRDSASEVGLALPLFPVAQN